MNDENQIDHPLKRGTKVRALAPRCPCSGKKFQIVAGSIMAVKQRNEKYLYQVAGEKSLIPQEAIIGIL